MPEKEPESPLAFHAPSLDRLFFWPYLAGFVDGEGTIGLYRRGVSRNYDGVLSIVNTNRDVLQYIRGMVPYGASRVNVGQRDKKRPHWNTIYWLGFHGHIAAQVLREIQPYLIIKREHCQLFLEAMQYINHHNEKGRTASKSEFEVTMLAGFCNSLAVLNKRGRDV